MAFKPSSRGANHVKEKLERLNKEHTEMSDEEKGLECRQGQLESGRVPEEEEDTYLWEVWHNKSPGEANPTSTTSKTDTVFLHNCQRSKG